MTEHVVRCTVCGLLRRSPEGRPERCERCSTGLLLAVHPRTLSEDELDRLPEGR